MGKLFNYNTYALGSFILAVFCFSSYGCSNSIEHMDDSTKREVKVTVTTNNDNSRLTASEDETSGGLNVFWSDGDKLGGWSMCDGLVSEFIMTNFTPESSDFKGSISAEKFKLIYPYEPEAVVSSSTYSLDLSSQTVDMTDDGLTSMGSYTYMLSDEVQYSESNISSPAMRHVGAALKVGIRFANLPNDDMIIQSATLEGSEGLSIPNKATINLAEVVDNESFMNITEHGSIKAMITNSPTVSDYVTNNTTYTLRLNILPFSLKYGEIINLTLTLVSASSGAPYTKTFSITYSGELAKEFSRATYTTLNYICDMNGVTTGNWLDTTTDIELIGNGSETEPYIISTAEELAKIASDVNGTSTTKSTNNDYTYYIELASDIDLGAYEWTPMGRNGFKGNINGKGFKIKNVYININDNNTRVGLFGYVSGGTIENIILENPTVKSTGNNVGALVGYSGASIYGCAVIGGSVSGYDYVGGLVGENYGKIAYCYSTASIDGHYAGGLLGNNSYSGSGLGSVTACYSAAEVNCTIGGVAGAFIVLNNSTLEACYWLDIDGDSATTGQYDSNGTTTKVTSISELNSAVTTLNSADDTVGYKFISYTDSTTLPSLTTR